MFAFQAFQTFKVPKKLKKKKKKFSVHFCGIKTIHYELFMNYFVLHKLSNIAWQRWNLWQEGAGGERQKKNVPLLVSGAAV